MAASRPGWYNASPDNNCAFNAAILGLCVLVKNGEITDDNVSPGFKDLLNKIQSIIGGNTVKSFAAYINGNTPLVIQKALQGLVREFIIEQCLQSEGRKQSLFIGDDSVYFKALLSEFTNYANNKNNLPQQDLFAANRSSYVAFIRDKFDQLIAAKHKGASDKAGLSQELIQELSRWWRNEGSDEYLKGMRQAGIWGGFIEMSTFARKLDIGLETFVNDDPLTNPNARAATNRDYGILEVDRKRTPNDELAIARLQNMGFLSDDFRWVKPLDDIEKVLSAVHREDKLINALPDIEHPLTAKSVPDIINRDDTLVRDLLERRIVKLDEKKRKLVFAVDHLRALELAAKIESPMVVKAFKSNPPNVGRPFISIINPHGLHYDNRTEPKSKASEVNVSASNTTKKITQKVVHPPVVTASQKAELLKKIKTEMNKVKKGPKALDTFDESKYQAPSNVADKDAYLKQMGADFELAEKWQEFDDIISAYRFKGGSVDYKIPNTNDIIKVDKLVAEELDRLHQEILKHEKAQPPAAPSKKSP